MPAQVNPENPLQGIDDHAMGGSTSSTNNSFLLPKRLEGKVAIVTGGAKGIGEAAVRLFAKHGARIVIADIDDAAGTALAESLSPASSAIYMHCDVSSEADVETIVHSTMARFGRLDVLFNNAGVLGSQSKAAKSIANLDADEFDWVMRVNVRGVALGMKHAARAMMGRGGCIISTASVAGVMGGLGPHAYAASKHAVVGLTRNAACELGRHGIRVNCISPFGVATSMLIDAWRKNNTTGDDDDHGNNSYVGLGGPSDHDENVEKMEEIVRGLANLKGVTLKARDVAEAALYLASDESKYVSGHNLVVDGGYTSSKNCVGL